MPTLRTTAFCNIYLNWTVEFSHKFFFFCDWVRVQDKVSGSYVDRDTKLRFVNFKKFMRNSKEEDEPFIHASQARQVFYCSDMTRKYWNVVLESPIRTYPNKNAYEDPFVFTATASEAPPISATVGEHEYWDGDAQVQEQHFSLIFPSTEECSTLNFIFC